MYSEHILQDVIYPGWEQEVPKHVEALGTLLDLDEQVLDFGVLGLPFIEDRILARWSNKSLQQQRATLFSPLLAYVGEIVRRQVDGQWLILKDRESGTLEPWIADELGRRYDVMSILDPMIDGADFLGLKAMAEIIPKLPHHRR